MATGVVCSRPQADFQPPLPHNPENEALRMETIRALGIDGDTFPKDPMLVSMCKTIAKLVDVPIAGISVVQDKQLHMRAAIGLPDGFCCAREGAFCSWTLLPKNPELLVIEDTLKDTRFANLDHVKGPNGLRFYAGAPLLSSNGTRLGAVCIFDTKPRKLTAEEYNILGNFSEIAIRRLEERDFKKIKRDNSKKLRRSESDLAQPLVLCDMTTDRWWSLLYCNEAFTDCTGVGVEGSDDSEGNFWNIFKPLQAQAKAQVQEQVESEIQAGKDFSITVMRRDSSNNHGFEMHFRPATTASLSNFGNAISVPNIVAATEIGDTASSYYFATVKQVDQLTTQRLAECQLKTEKHPIQKTFLSKGQDAGEDLEAKEGMKDVTMGVLCCNSPSGLVYRARWKKRSVSVRVVEAKISDCSLFPEFGDTAVPTEAAVSLKMSHPNIIMTFKVVVEDSQRSESARKMSLIWMVREWCGRGTLNDALQRGWLREGDGKINMAALLAVAREVAAAMTHLHDQDIIHGDLNPDSVVLRDDKDHSASKSKDFVVKLSEFGLSIRPDSIAASSGIGAASHAAPELMVKGEKSKSTDVYAFGMLMWELYMGQAVWPSLNFSQLHRRVVAAKEKPPMPEDMPVSLKELIEECLSHEPEGRPGFLKIEDSLRRLTHEQAAGQLVYGLAVPQEKARPKLFRMESRKEREERKLATASLPSQDMKKPSLNKLPSRRDMIPRPTKEPAQQSSSKSLLKKLLPGLKKS